MCLSYHKIMFLAFKILLNFKDLVIGFLNENSINFMQSTTVSQYRLYCVILKRII